MYGGMYAGMHACIERKVAVGCIQKQQKKQQKSKARDFFFFFEMNTLTARF